MTGWVTFWIVCFLVGMTLGWLSLRVDLLFVAAAIAAVAAARVERVVS